MILLTLPGINVPAATNDDSEHFAIVDVKLFDGFRAHPRATVVVNDGEIEAVHLRKAPGLSRGVKKIAGKGYTLIPL